jgi:hypothetical protein
LVPGGYKIQIKRHDDGSLVTYGEVLRRLKGRDNEMISLLTNSILETGFKAVFWETVPISSSQLSWLPFEFVVLNAPSLARKAVDISSFTNQFRASPGKSIISFVNLGNDAILVAPYPVYHTNLQHYTHLASFLRDAVGNQRMEFWRKVGEEMFNQLTAAAPTDSPLWLSTNGLGVSWLHVRIDIRPKYYNYTSYNNWQIGGKITNERNINSQHNNNTNIMIDVRSRLAGQNQQSNNPDTDRYHRPVPLELEENDRIVKNGNDTTLHTNCIFVNLFQFIGGNQSEEKLNDNNMVYTGNDISPFLLRVLND